MTADFAPRLDILPPPQRRLWDELAAVPEEFVLYGGTALALHLRHRESLDFDFFGNKPLDPAELVPAVSFLVGAIVTQRDRPRSGTLMKTIPLTPDTEALARRLVWFEPPTEALSDTSRFVAYALVRATHEDMTLLRKFLSDDDLREALDHAPPGIIDPRSWAYWNSRLGRYPAPPMPERQLG
jgi:hypothetical protein